MIIKPHRRTIKIKIEGRIYKYLLNLPELEFNIHWPSRDNPHYSCGTYNEKGQKCFVPLFNVDVYDTICMGNLKPQNEEELADSFFNSFFTPDIKSGLYRTISSNNNNIRFDCDNYSSYLKFFEEWEKTGICKLVAK
jgi:hypothetical protein